MSTALIVWLDQCNITTKDILHNLEMGLANDAATSPLPSPLRGEGRGEASVSQDPRQYKEAGQRGRYNHEQQL